MHDKRSSSNNLQHRENADRDHQAETKKDGGNGNSPHRRKGNLCASFRFYKHGLAETADQKARRALYAMPEVRRATLLLQRRRALDSRGFVSRLLGQSLAPLALPAVWAVAFVPIRLSQRRCCRWSLFAYLNHRALAFQRYRQKGFGRRENSGHRAIDRYGPHTVRRIVRLAEEGESVARRRGPRKASYKRYGIRYFPSL